MRCDSQSDAPAFSDQDRNDRVEVGTGDVTSSDSENAPDRLAESSDLNLDRVENSR
jgi:hypothetical protein